MQKQSALLNEGKKAKTHRSSLGFYINGLQYLYNFLAINYRFTFDISSIASKTFPYFYRINGALSNQIVFYRKKMVLREKKTLTYLKPCIFSHRLFCLCKPISLT